MEYSVTALVGYTYSWVITGGTLVSGDGTSEVVVDWGAAGAGSVQGQGLRRRAYRDTVEPKTAGNGPNRPGPSGFRPAGARSVEALVRSPATHRALLLADLRTGRETELIQSGHRTL